MLSDAALGAVAVVCARGVATAANISRSIIQQKLDLECNNNEEPRGRWAAEDGDRALAGGNHGRKYIDVSDNGCNGCINGYGGRHES